MNTRHWRKFPIVIIFVQLVTIFAWLPMPAHAVTLLATPQFAYQLGGYMADGQLTNPYLAEFHNGYIYVADAQNDRIQVFNASDGSFVKKFGVFGTGNGQFNQPFNVVFDSNNYMYVSDSGNNRIQKFDVNGNYIGQWGSAGSGNGQFSQPWGLGVDSSNNIYVVDYNNARVQKFDSNGNFLLKWGSLGTADGQFNQPIDVSVDASGSVYVSMRGGGQHRVQKFDSNGNFILKWGGATGTGNGQFNQPHNIDFDSSGNVFVVDGNNNRVQKFTNTGTYLSQFGTLGIGDGQMRYPLGISIDKSTNKMYVSEFYQMRVQAFDSSFNFLYKFGSTTDANGKFVYPYGSAIDSSGNLFVSDGLNNRVQKFDSNGNFITKWGTSGSGDGQFNNPRNIAIDSANNVYVADSSNARIQKFDNNGNFITKWGTSGSGDGQFTSPFGVAVDSTNSVYVVDTSARRVQKFDSSGTFLLKWGSSGSGNGQFSNPDGIAVDSSNNLYVADTSNNRIQKFTSSGTYVSQFGTSGSGNGQLFSPFGVSVAPSGNIVVADTGNQRVQIFDSSGIYVTAFGSLGNENYKFRNPLSISTDSQGSIYVSDQNHKLAKYYMTLGQVSNLNAALDVTDVSGNSIKVGSSYGLYSGDAYLKKGTSFIAKVQAMPGISDIDWSVVTADVDMVNGKSFAHNLAGAPGAASSYTLYVPRLAGHNAVTICPGATSLAGVSTTCANAVELTLGTSGQYTVNSITLNGVEYWQIDGVTGTGGLSTPGYPGLTSATSTFTLTPNASGVNTTQEVVAHFVASSQFSSGQQIAIDFATGGSFTLASCTSPTVNADGDGSADGSGAVQTNGGPNNDRYIYTFTASTTQATTTGINLCIRVTSPGVASNYKVDMVNSLGQFSSTFYYVGNENQLNVIGTVDPVLTFEIRNATDTAPQPNVNGASVGPNLCNLGNLSNVGVQSCSYRLKVSTNASGGYIVNIQTDGNLRKGVNSITNVIEDSTNVTSGVEGYGIALDAGSSTSGTVTEAGNFSDDDTPIGSGTNTTLYSVSGVNNPGSTDTINTALVTHKAEASSSTPAGTYTQLVTYTVSAAF